MNQHADFSKFFIIETNISNYRYAKNFGGGRCVAIHMSPMRRISIIDGPIFKLYDGSKMGYRVKIFFGNSNGADFSYQLHLGMIKKDSLHPVYLF